MGAAPRASKHGSEEVTRMEGMPARAKPPAARRPLCCAILPSAVCLFVSDYVRICAYMSMYVAPARTGRGTREGRTENKHIRNSRKEDPYPRTQGHPFVGRPRTRINAPQQRQRIAPLSPNASTKRIYMFHLPQSSRAPKLLHAYSDLPKRYYLCVTGGYSAGQGPSSCIHATDRQSSDYDAHRSHDSDGAGRACRGVAPRGARLRMRPGRPRCPLHDRLRR